MADLNEKIVSLKNCFEQLILRNPDTRILNDLDQEYDWRNELLDLVVPLLDSLKSVAQKPRQIAALAKSNDVLIARQIFTSKAITAITTATLGLNLFFVSVTFSVI